jgi:hypothetical protein
MRVKIIHLAWLILLAAAFACQKEKSFEKNPNGSGNIAAGDFVATIDGTAWQASANSKFAFLYGAVTIIGISSDNKEIRINLSAAQIGTFNLDAVSAEEGFFVDLSATNPASLSTFQSADTSKAGGTVTISSIDSIHKTISGNFKISVYRQSDQIGKRITEGAFNQLPYVENLPPPKLTDTLSATIDGNTWAPANILAGLNSGLLYILGFAIDTSSLELFMPQNAGPGNHLLDVNGEYVGQYLPNLNTVLLSQGNGSGLTILQNDPIIRRIKGSFDFQAVELGGPGSAQVSNGYFSVEY